jgi:hypothetical protein
VGVCVAVSVGVMVAVFVSVLVGVSVGVAVGVSGGPPPPAARMFTSPEDSMDCQAGNSTSVCAVHGPPPSVEV